MARQTNGTYQQPAGTTAVSLAAIGSSAFNTLMTDFGTEITNSLDRNGRSAMQAALPMGGQKITGMADPTSATDGATKNYVDTSNAAFFSTGDAKLTYKVTADAGWIMADDRTIGNGSSNATARANADTAALFAVIWVIGANHAPIFNSDGSASTYGATSAADYAANKRLSVPKVLGRLLGVAGAGSGLTNRALGQSNIGTEAVTLSQANLPSVTLATDIPAGQGTHVHAPATGTHFLEAGAVGSADAVGGGSGAATTTGAATLPQMSGNTPLGGSNTPFSILPPSSFINLMIKL